jgi:hypothetical protein
MNIDINQIKQLSDNISKFANDSEKISLQIFAAKLSRVLKDYPEDQTIGMMSNIVDRMSNKNNFISRSEVVDLYNKLYTRNTKFAELFKDELGVIKKLAGSKLYDRSVEQTELNTDTIVDPFFASALAAAFGTKTNPFNETQAKNAKTAVNAAINFVRLNSKVDVINGTDSIILCLATFETPKGSTSVFIPVEVYDTKVAAPRIFVGIDGPQDFSTSAIEGYVVKNAGNKLNINENVVLAAISNVKNSDISSVDFALAKLHASQGKEEIPGIYTELDPELPKEIFTPTFVDPEMSSFAKVFETPTGVAEFKFGRSAVKTGRDLISTKLNALGVSNFQIAVCDSETNLVFAVKADNSAFKVPLNVENGMVSMPMILISNGTIESFSKAGLQRIFKQEAIDYKTAASASPSYQLKASELVDTVREAVSEENYAKAEDALNILATRGDDKAYQTAFNEYTNGLTGKKVSEQPGCNMVRESSSSKHKVCGHTGLPLHKVFQDATGNCLPLYRKAMVDTKEGAYFMNSKIFF